MYVAQYGGDWSGLHTHAAVELLKRQDEWPLGEDGSAYSGVFRIHRYCRYDINHNDRVWTPETNEYESAHMCATSPATVVLTCFGRMNNEQSDPAWAI